MMPNLTLTHQPAGELRSPGTQRVRLARSQRGMALIIVITMFAIVMTFCAAWTKATLGRLHQQQLAEQQAQASWLAESGVRRGAARVAADANYDGESWLVPAAEIARLADARVEIQVAIDDDAAQVAKITAVATYPAEQPRVRVRKIVTFPLPAQEPPQ